MGSENFLCYEKHLQDKLLSFAPMDEKYIKPIEYKSNGDEDLKIIETDFNYLCLVQLFNYINILEDFKKENATLSFNKDNNKTSFSINDFKDPMNVDLFMSFINEKLKHLDEIYNNSKIQEEDSLNSFKNKNLMELHKSLNAKLIQYLNIDTDENKKKDIIEKKHLIPLGVLFAISDVLGKVKLIFDLFKENDIFRNSNDFNEYLISSFFLSSYCLVSSGYQLYKEDNVKFSKFDLKIIQEKLKIYNFKNCETLLKEFIKSFFSDNNPINWEKFKQKFEGPEGFQWILSSKGIRSKLESIKQDN